MADQDYACATAARLSSGGEWVLASIPFMLNRIEASFPLFAVLSGRQVIPPDWKPL
jgi:hypothetical protein